MQLSQIAATLQKTAGEEVRRRPRRSGASERSVRSRVTKFRKSLCSRPSDAEIVFYRLMALVMLLTLAFSNVETVLGVLRDGEVHHESSASAAAHALQAQGEHGHEDGRTQGTEHEHGPQHEHGTTADHCTHQHGNLTTSRAPALALLAFTIPDLFFEPSLWLDRFSEPSFRPPQA